jgi:hypothetical protein
LSRSELFLKCVSEPNPESSLMAAVLDARASGVEKSSILADLEDLRRELREARREDRDDVVLEVMDYVTGWCAPHMRIP